MEKHTGKFATPEQREAIRAARVNYDNEPCQATKQDYVAAINQAAEANGLPKLDEGRYGLSPNGEFLNPCDFSDDEKAAAAEPKAPEAAPAPDSETSSVSSPKTSTYTFKADGEVIHTEEFIGAGATAKAQELANEYGEDVTYFTEDSEAAVARPNLGEDKPSP